MGKENIPPEHHEGAAKGSDEFTTGSIASKARHLLTNEAGEVSTSVKVGLGLGLAAAASVAAIAAYEGTRPDGHSYIQAQKFLEAAAKPLPVEAQLQGESINQVAVDTTIVIKVKPDEPPVALYHTPFGFDRIGPPKESDPESATNPLVINPGYAAIIPNPRKIAFPDQSRQPIVYAMNLPGIKTKSNLATDAALMVFITDSQLYELGARYYAPGGEQRPPLDATVGPDGNLEIPGENGSFEISSEITVMPIREVGPYLSKHELKPRRTRNQPDASNQPLHPQF